jgi:hypothetical protein
MIQSSTGQLETVVPLHNPAAWVIVPAPALGRVLSGGATGEAERLRSGLMHSLKIAL